MGALLPVARLTAANGVRQPLTWLVVLLGVVLMGLSWLFGMFSFEEESRLRVLCTAGVATVSLAGLFLGVYGASSAIHDELASRTALTLFAKPLSRPAFLVGKAAGVMVVVACAALPLIVVHAVAVWAALRFGFDIDLPADRRGPLEVSWVPWGRMALAHLLALAAAGVMTCLAAVLALRLGLVANLATCAGVFLLTNLLSLSGWAVPAVLPALAVANLDESLQFADLVPGPGYVTLSFLHLLLYGAACLLLGSAAFSRQDIP